MSDAGVYKCKFQNEQGEDETQGKVQIKPVSQNLFAWQNSYLFVYVKNRCLLFNVPNIFAGPENRGTRKYHFPF